MKVLAVSWKAIKYLLWIILLGVLILLFVGYLKFDGGARAYTRYLNDKERSTSIDQIQIWNPISYGNLFWDLEKESDDEWEDIETETWFDLVEWIEVEELEITGLNLTGMDDLDISDADFIDEFDEYFGTENEEKNDESWKDLDFWFVDEWDEKDWSLINDDDMQNNDTGSNFRDVLKKRWEEK